MDQNSRPDLRHRDDLAELEAHDRKVSRAHITVNRAADSKATPIGEECRVLDNFHLSHSAVDDRAGHKFRARRDASVVGFGNGFGSYELSIPTYVVKSTKQLGRTRTATINTKAYERNSYARLSIDNFLLFEGRMTKEVYEEVCSVFICGDTGDI